MPYNNVVEIDVYDGMGYRVMGTIVPLTDAFDGRIYRVRLVRLYIRHDMGRKFFDAEYRHNRVYATEFWRQMREWHIERLVQDAIA